MRIQIARPSLAFTSDNDAFDDIIIIIAVVVSLNESTHTFTLQPFEDFPLLCSDFTR